MKIINDKINSFLVMMREYKIIWWRLSSIISKNHRFPLTFFRFLNKSIIFFKFLKNVKEGWGRFRYSILSWFQCGKISHLPSPPQNTLINQLAGNAFIGSISIKSTLGCDKVESWSQLGNWVGDSSSRIWIPWHHFHHFEHCCVCDLLSTAG